jgi:hypothetical protein
MRVDCGIGQSGRRWWSMVCHSCYQQGNFGPGYQTACTIVENAGGKPAIVGGTKESYTDIMMMLKSLLRTTRDL